MNFNQYDWLPVKPTKVNGRAELNGPDEKQFAMDIDFECETDVSILDKLCIGDPPDFKSFLFTEKGEVRPMSLEAMKFDRKFDEHHMTISFSPLRDHDGAQRFLVKHIKKFRAEPVNGFKVKLSFQIQHNPKGENDIGWLEKNCNEVSECYLKFEVFQQDLADQADELSSRRNRRRKPEPVPA